MGKKMSSVKLLKKIVLVENSSFTECSYVIRHFIGVGIP